MNIYQNAADNAKEEGHHEIWERRLWSAVLLQALEDWKSCNLRLRREAEKFFFESEQDFGLVCKGAGLEPASVLGRLRRMRTSLPEPWTAFRRAA